MNLTSFLVELKRRNVYKVAVAYAVVAWLLMQIATQIFPFFEIPNWAVRLVVLLLILGFPIALVLAWAFEITPEGIKRAEDVDLQTSITHKTGRKLIATTVVLAVIAAGLFAFQLFRSKSSVTAASSKIAIASVENSPVPEKSVAVLPFENLSDERSNAYFANGIQDEILTRLSKIADLKVISRTSTQKYQSAPDNLRVVARELGVANLLEGSVQKAGNAVHINVQLIKAATDAHVWAESYNRKLDDIFGVEGEVASAIAEQLNARLSGEEQKALATKPTQNVAAYDAYLRGISIEHSRYSYGAYQEAAQNYATAVQSDPNFGLAWARLAIARSYLYFNGIDLAVNSAAAVKEAADQAISLQPELGEALAAQGTYRYRVLRDFSGALQSYKEALKRLPNSTLILENMAHVERRLGQWEAAGNHYQTAAQLDPRNVNTLFSEADLAQSLRHFKKAEAIYNRILEISPGNETGLANKAFLLQSEDRLGESAAALGKIAPDSKDNLVAVARTLQFVFERHFDAAIAQLEPTTAPPKSADPRSLTLLGFCQEWAGRESEARARFARAVTAIKPSPTTVVPVDARQLPCYLAWAYAGLGDKEKALAQAQHAVADYENDILARPFAEQTLAQIQARFGEMDAAFAALPHLLEVTNGITRGYLRIDPFWDPLRKDPRFQKLLESPSASEKDADHE